jgi:hypothetical protein
MKRPRSRHVLAAAAALSVLAVPLAGAASAQSGAEPTATSAPRTSTRIDAVRSRCLAAVDRRTTTLDSLDARLSAAQHVSDEQEAQLHATIDATRQGLSSLRAEIESDGDATALREDCRRIVEDFRVYVVLAPQVRLLAAADSAQSAVARIDEVVPTLQSAIDDAAAGGADVTEPTRLLAEVQSVSADADARAEGVLTSVTPLTPADHDAGTATPVLRQARTDLLTVAKDLRTARADIATIHDLLG